MSVLKTEKGCTIISHEKFLNNLYLSVQANGKDTRFIINKHLFAVIFPYKSSSKDLQKFKIEDSFNDINFVRDTYGKYKIEIAATLQNENSDTLVTNFSEESKKTSGNLIKAETIHFKGGNNSDKNVISIVNGILCLIPHSCLFFNYDVNEIDKHLQEKYDVIIADPPWWNKYIRRKRKLNPDDGYKMMWDQDFAKLPLAQFLAKDGLVAVWCTNSSSHIEAVIRDIFPNWGVEFVTQWFWLKVTNTGDVVTPFSAPKGKQPFERLIFGARTSTRSLPLPDDNRVIVSVPSAIHSHKPPLSEVLKPFLPENPKGLELFARYLLPNWTSYGNQVLKLQDLSLFAEVS